MRKDELVLKGQRLKLVVRGSEAAPCQTGNFGSDLAAEALRGIQTGSCGSTAGGQRAKGIK